MADSVSITNAACSGEEFREDCLIDMLRNGGEKGPVQISTLSDYMKADVSDVKDALQILSKEGRVTVTGDSVSFTESGMRFAKEIRKKHHVMEKFLMDVLGMDHQSAHAEAHQTEHTMTQESMQTLCHATGNTHDEDCSVCSNPCNGPIQIATVESLFDMKVRSRGKIAFLRGKSPEDSKKLMSMGFVPGRSITVESRVSARGPRVVSLGNSSVAVDAELSKAILVNVGA